MADYDGYSVYLQPPKRTQPEAPNAPNIAESAAQKADEEANPDGQLLETAAAVSQQREVKTVQAQTAEKEEVQRTCPTLHQNGAGKKEKSSEAEDRPSQQAARKSDLKPAQKPGWADREVVRVIKSHATEMTSLSGGWGNCSFM